jgi:hypothetical protein
MLRLVVAELPPLDNRIVPGGPAACPAALTILTSP